jgi:hypothetical protein
MTSTDSANLDFDTAALPSYADVTPLTQEWLWDGYIPFGRVTLLAGDSGIGKGFMLSDIAARVSRGDRMPDGTPGTAPGHVIMITPEDDPRTCTVHRLAAHDADLSMVHDLTLVGGNTWCIQEDVTALRQLITACGGAALVIIDPISAVTLVGLTSDVPVRRKVLGPLEAVARETGAAIVIVGHLTKTGAAQAQRNRAAAKDGMGGTKGLTNAARLMLTVVRDDADPRIRTISVAKSNGTDDRSAPAVRYTIEGTPPKVRWLTAADGQGTARTGGQEAAVLEVLEQAAKHGAPVHARSIAIEAGLPYDTARVILSRLCAKGAARPVGSRSGLYAAEGARLLNVIGGGR